MTEHKPASSIQDPASPSGAANDPVSPEISVVVPVYNEAPNLKDLVEQIFQVMRPMDRSFEVILTDDGSTDASPDLLRAIRSLWPRFSRHLEGLLILWQHPKRLLCVLGLSFSLQALGMGAVALLGAGINIHLPLSFYFASLPLIGIITLIPVSFNGIGVREGAFVYFFGLKGIEAEPAFGLGLLFFSVQVGLSLIGGIAYAAGGHRRSILNK